MHGDSLQVFFKWDSDSVTFKVLFKGTVFIDRVSCRKAYLVGIVVPDPEVFVSWAEERGFVESYKELCQNPVCHRTFWNFYVL